MRDARGRLVHRKKPAKHHGASRPVWFTPATVTPAQDAHSVVADPTCPVTREEEERAESARRAAERIEVERQARIREEERRALLKRLDKMPSDKRARYLEEERILAWGRSIIVKLKDDPPPLHRLDPVVMTEVFGDVLADTLL